MEICTVKFHTTQSDGQGGKERVITNSKNYLCRVNETRAYIKNSSMGWDYSTEKSIWVFEKDSNLQNQSIKDMEIYFDGKKQIIKEKGVIAGSCIFLIQ